MANACKDFAFHKCVRWISLSIILVDQMDMYKKVVFLFFWAIAAIRNVSRAAVSLLHILYTRSGAVKWQHGCGSKAAVKTAVGDTYLVSKQYIYKMDVKGRGIDEYMIPTCLFWCCMSGIFSCVTKTAWQGERHLTMTVKNSEFQVQQSLGQIQQSLDLVLRNQASKIKGGFGGNRNVTCRQHERYWTRVGYIF